MQTLRDIELAAISALKAGDRTRLDVLRLLINQIKMIAKQDGNREAVADDVITAANRMIKQGRETRDIIAPDTGGKTVTITDEIATRVRAIDAEIKIVSEFLPQRLMRDELETIIRNLAASGPEGKAARGHVMKNLNATYRGQFDPRQANEIVMEMFG